jgi:hypothetical protein
VCKCSCVCACVCACGLDRCGQDKKYILCVSVMVVLCNDLCLLMSIRIHHGGGSRHEGRFSSGRSGE